MSLSSLAPLAGRGCPEGGRGARLGLDRRSLAFLFALLVLAFPSFAQTYGPISIEARKEFGAPSIGHYFEQRFRIANRSADAHAVRLTLESTATRGASDRATRTFQIPARSVTVVAVPYLVTGYFTPDETIVAIDGREQSDRVRVNQQSSWEENTNPNVLLSRSVQYRTVTRIDVRRPEVAPSEWSASWLQYGRHEAIAVTASDWLEFPPPVRDAILRWAFAGGALIFVDRLDPLPVPISSTGRYGLGTVQVFDDMNGVVDEERIFPYLQWRTRDESVFQSAANELPLLAENILPVRGLFGVLLAFAIIGGPVNLVLLAKKNRRMWVFGTIPLLAMATSILLVGATIANEGWVRIQRSLSITYLDETLGNAATLGWTGFYATVSPRGTVRFDSETELRPLVSRNTGNADTRWDDGQRLFGSWVGTRVPTYFVARKSEPRRERLPLRADGVEVGAVETAPMTTGVPKAWPTSAAGRARGMAGVNGLGSHIERVWVANDAGEVFEAANVAPGRAFKLVRSGTISRVRESPQYQVDRMMHVDTWTLVLAAAQNDPGAVLAPGTYVAVLRDSPFLERALERATTSTRRGVVYGVSSAVGGKR